LSLASSFTIFDVDKLLTKVDLYPKWFYECAGSGGAPSGSKLC